MLQCSLPWSSNSSWQSIHVIPFNIIMAVYSAFLKEWNKINMKSITVNS